MVGRAKTFFLAPVGSDVPMTSIGLGLVRAVERNGLKAGYIKPIRQKIGTNRASSSTHFARTLFHIPAPEPISADRLEDAVRNGDISQLLEEVVSFIQPLQQNYDVVFVEGLLPDTHSTVDSYSINGQIARGLAADYILIASTPENKAEEDFLEQLEITRSQYEVAGKESVIGVAIGSLAGHIVRNSVFDASKIGAKLPVLAVVPHNPKYDGARMADVVNTLQLKVENPGDMTRRRMQDVILAAESVETVKAKLRAGVLVVTPADRADIIQTVAQAALNGTMIAGLLITDIACWTGQSDATVSAAQKAGLPVFSTNENIFACAAQLAAYRAYLNEDDNERAQSLFDHVADHVNIKALLAKIGEDVEARMTPPAFRQMLIEAARAANKRIVLPEGDEPRTLKAAAICHEKRIAHCVLVGNPQHIRDVAKAEGIELPSDIEIVDLDKARSTYVAPMVELRKSKGLTPEQAGKELEDSVVLGTMMLATGDVDGLVSGAVHTTASTVRPALQLIKTAPGNSIVSSVFFMLMPDQVLAYGDCAINPNPTAPQLAEIAWQSADSAKAFGLNPRVAMISYSTGTSGIGEDVELVKEATAIVKDKRPDIAVDGPIQYDAATVPSVGKLKAPNSPVAGHANVFIFPDLNTGNTTYKAVQRSANVVSVGPMLQGLRKPVNDLSRGALVEDIVFTIALTAIQAVSQK